MLALLLVAGALCLVAVAGGRALQSKAFCRTAHGRVLLAAGLAMAAGVGRLVLFGSRSRAR